MNNKNSNFGELNIEFVLQQDVPDAKRIRNARRAEIQTDCPFCGHTKLYVNTQKNTYYCHHCKEHGGMLALHMKYTGISTTKSALADLKARLANVPEIERKKMIQQASQPVVESKAANIDRRDMVYHRLIDIGFLSKDDRADLLRRGLSDEIIKRYGIISVPVLCKTTADKIISNGEDYEFRVKSAQKFGSDIPGIYPTEDGVCFVKLKAGILIPVVNRNGKISMFQVRYQESGKKNVAKGYKFHKYAQLSSGFMEKGCSTSGLEKVHYVGFPFDGTTPNTVCITEGCLKADVASYLEHGSAYIAILGVNNTNQLSDEMDYCIAHGTKNFRIRYDMDFLENDAVAMAIYQTNKMLQEKGFESIIFKPYKANAEWQKVYDVWKKTMNGQIGQRKLPALNYTVIISKDQMTPKKNYAVNDLWNPSLGKGIDDYLKNR